MKVPFFDYPYIFTSQEEGTMRLGLPMQRMDWKCFFLQEGLVQVMRIVFGGGGGDAGGDWSADYADLRREKNSPLITRFYTK